MFFHSFAVLTMAGFQKVAGLVPGYRRPGSGLLWRGGTGKVR